MRVWGRIYDAHQSTYTWVAVSTTDTGNNDYVYTTAFCQVLQLQTNESPFFADYGLPVKKTITDQVFPDYNVYLMQKRYAGFFASLLVSPNPSVNEFGAATPNYNVQITTIGGNQITQQVAL